MKKKTNVIYLIVSVFVSVLSITVFSLSTQAEVLDYENTDTLVSKSMSLDELILDIAKTTNTNPIQIQKELFDTNPELFIQSRNSAPTKQFRLLQQQFEVSSEFKPTVAFYCETSESGSFRAIKKILRVELIRGYKGISKQFNGTMYVNLEDPNVIYYIINGDYFNNGTTTYEAGVNIGLGELSAVSFKASNSSNHYKYRAAQGRVRF